MLHASLFGPVGPLNQQSKYTTKIWIGFRRLEMAVKICHFVLLKVHFFVLIEDLCMIDVYLYSVHRFK